MLDPLAHAAIVALFGAGLGTLRTEPAGSQQPPDMIGMVDDLELLSDDIDDPPARPQARGVAGGFRSRHDEARQMLSLRGGQLWWSPRRRACPQTSATAPAVRTLPSAHGTPIHAEAFGHDMHGDITLEQIDRAEPPSLELRWAPLWAHAHLPQGSIGHYLYRSH